MVAEKTSTTLSISQKKLNERVIEMERNMQRPEQYSLRKCIKIAGVPNSIIFLKEHVILIFQKLGVVMEPMEIVACHRLGETGKVIVK